MRLGNVFLAASGCWFALALASFALCLISDETFVAHTIYFADGLVSLFAVLACGSKYVNEKQTEKQKKLDEWKKQAELRLNIQYLPLLEEEGGELK